MRYLDGKALYFAFLSGANAVIQQKSILNKINVFPIADGDTGSNLASTMNAIIEEASFFDSAKHTLNSISDAVLIGARGNSGIIFAQFITGINTEIGEVDRISIQDFVEAVKRAIPYAYRAVSNPIEGTILTVMHDWAESLTDVYERVKSFEELFTQSLIVAAQSLQDTPNKLKVLKKASVVDSGGKGFVFFLEGFLRFVQNGKIEDIQRFKDDPLILQIENTHTDRDIDIPFRYCTEALLYGEHIEIESLKNILSTCGDSLIVAGNEKKVRIHIHTNEPQEIFFRVREFGRIIQQKVDDMKIQNGAIYHRKHSIALVTDSIADLPQEFIDQEQIHVIPLNILIEESNYYDKLTLTSNQLFGMLNSLDTYPTSSQPSAKSVENLFSFLTEYYDSVIAITVSKELSGTYQTIVQAAKVFTEKGKKITVINSKLNSGAQGLLAMRAAEAIQTLKNHEEVVALIEKTISKSKIFVSIHTLSYMLRSGRVNSTTAWVAKMLNLKPVVSLDDKGKGSIFGKAFSAKGNTKVIYRFVKSILKDTKIQEYCIVHADAPERATEYERVFTELIGTPPKYIVNISAITAMSAGIGSTAIAFITE